jgi:hypothetical protein
LDWRKENSTARLINAENAKELFGVYQIGNLINLLFLNYFFYNINKNKMNLLLIVLIIVLLFYVCQCAKDRFDNSLYLGYGGESQFRDMTEDFGGINTINPDSEAKANEKRKNAMLDRRQDGLRTGTWRNCRREKSFRWCFNNWKG